MYPLNDKNLDRLGRDAAKRHDVESSASGWKRLESRLDKELPVKEKERKRFLFWLFLIALLSGGSLIYMLGRSPGTANLQASHKPATATGNKGHIPAEKEDSKSRDHIGFEDKLPSDTIIQLQAVSTKGSAPAKKASQAAGSVQQDKSKDITKFNDKAWKNKTLNESAVARKQEKKMDVDAIDRPEKENPEKATVTTLDPIETESAAYESDAANRVNETADKKPVTGKIKQSPQSRWEFGIMAGPDFSNVGFKYTYNTGINAGVMVGYRITDRWLVNTGLIYTKKFYKVSGEDYYPPKHYWTQYIDLDYLKGNCSMFEIPVNIRYDAIQSNKNRYFASTGLTSYIMNKQGYTYYYWQNGVYKNKNWATDSTFRHWISVVNLSFGIERSLGQQFSIQAEPYLKVPLAGVGFGKIKLNSYGLYLTFKYKPVGRSKK